ncbi:3-hydroxybutyryl-CoA dehydrogenase [Roseococcus sp. YIM B11640]|uniref:3-hydroxybutyryl-CoA dehydrogenase n=1 Tax=Roseococcus sp. YIM B11640 TaxID=3133973 RepID=UPI003C7DA0DB
MASERARILCLGAGRMGRGIAVCFAYAGHEVAILDFKPRDEDAFVTLATAALKEVRSALTTLAGLGLFDAAHVSTIMKRVSVVPASGAAPALAEADIVFEGVPEVVETKRDALSRASAEMRPDAILASTTSTILVDELSFVVAHPGRFLNAHWLNPAFIVPLVEVSPGRATLPEVTARLNAVLESIGKVPVVCAASPGFIVPRIQALAMNEAARMVEEGVASAADIDKAVKYGFGFRFGVLGILEFIDWGGGDTLYHASRYLTSALHDPRYAAPPIIERNMREGHTGLGTGRGFLDYENMDLDAYRRSRLGALVERLRADGLARPPVL